METIKALAQRARRVIDGQAKELPDDERPHVVIIGAGFGGLNAAKALGDAPVRVTLVDRNNYHKFQPLLYQVATAGLDPEEIAHNVRSIFRRHPNVTFRLATIRDIDKERRQLHTQAGDVISYDYLVLAAGAATNYFGVEGAAEHSFPLKNLTDGIALRNHILRRFERAERDPEGAGEGALNFVVVGGGPTGVETAGALTELFRVLQDDYHCLDTRQARAFLIEMLPQLLPAYDERQGAYARRVLEGRGVQVMTDTTVEKVTSDAVVLESGETIPTKTLIWAAGVQAHPLAGKLDVEQTKGGRVRVERDLSVPGHPELFVIGDMAAAEDEDGEPYPQLAPVAIQQGKHASEQILRRAAGTSSTPFEYLDRGKMATIGRNAAVAELPGGLRLEGFIAWVAWVFIHIAKLVGFRNRANVFINWAYNYFTYDRNARLILDVVPVSDDIPYEVEDVDAWFREHMDEMERGEDLEHD